MRNREEFEEYVRGLAEKKLALKQKKQTRLCRAVFGLGGCAAAGICIALAVYINLASGSLNRENISPEMGTFPLIKNEIEGNENATDSLNGIVCTVPQDKDYSEAESSGTGSLDESVVSESESFAVCLPEEFTLSVSSDKEGSKSGPHSVNISFKNRSFKLEEEQNISRIVNALNMIEVTGQTDSSDETAYITLEFVYSDKTVTYIFTEYSLEISGKGTYTVPSGTVSGFADLVDSLTASEK